MWLAKEDLIYSRVVDAGCGSGRLAIGSALLGAWHVIAIDVDPNVLRIAKKNAERLGVQSFIDFVQCDYAKPCVKACDIVVQNPPFGVQSPHNDRLFIKSSLDISKIVYSMHKAGTKKFIVSLFRRFGGEIVWIKRHVIILKHTMPHHSKRAYPVEVEIYKAVKVSCNGCPENDEARFRSPR